jgi:hypothetical protein
VQLGLQLVNAELVALQVDGEGLVLRVAQHVGVQLNGRAAVVPVAL